jgi:CheY-like chemotaxis protein
VRSSRTFPREVPRSLSPDLPERRFNGFDRQALDQRRLRGAGGDVLAFAAMPTVLVVDDYVDILNAVSETLTEEGWEVVGALSADDAVRVARARRVDVVLCDVLLGNGTDGADLRSRFTREGLGRLPFAFMTASTREVPRLTGARILRKPFLGADVVGLLNSMLSGRTPRPHTPPPS